MWPFEELQFFGKQFQLGFTSNVVTDLKSMAPLSTHPSLIFLVVSLFTPLFLLKFLYLHLFIQSLSFCCRGNSLMIILSCRVCFQSCFFIRKALLLDHLKLFVTHTLSVSLFRSFHPSLCRASEVLSVSYVFRLTAPFGFLTQRIERNGLC